MFRNIFACLVHEKKECVKDLARNLHHHDPESIILLYNGGIDRGLLNDNFPYRKLNTYVHPNPTPQKHGYLHGFAIDCMRYALKNFTFDTLTIVDSDQLCLRHGYSKYLEDALAISNGNLGLYSSDAKRVLPDNRKNHIALQAFKEYTLWQRFLKRFENGEDSFVYWTFWPSTVFSHDAIADLIEFLDQDSELQTIIARSKIWALEEILFPTLVKLLGYDIRINPCRHDYVKYKKTYNTADLNIALREHEVFWMHPVPRYYENHIRKNIRLMNNNYAMKSTTKPLASTKNGFFSNIGLLDRVHKIQGWLSTTEADLLMTTTLKACIDFPEVGSIVEIGSFHGKSTVLFGNLIKEFCPVKKVFAIDPHNGVVGAVGQKLINLPSTEASFKLNIKREELSKNVELIKDYSYNVKWRQPIALLFIDGLHDYTNVSKDFRHFEPHIIHGGYIAFHDYANYYPGVISFVNELLSSQQYVKVYLADSLIVLQNLGVD